MLGYSNGEFRAGDGDYLSGGQCEDGLKMIIVIGQTEVPTSGGNGGGQGPGSPLPTQLATGETEVPTIGNIGTSGSTYYEQQSLSLTQLAGIFISLSLMHSLGYS